MVAAGPGVKARGESKALGSLVGSRRHVSRLRQRQKTGYDGQPLAPPLLAGRTKVLRSHLVSALEEWRLVWDGRHKLFDLQSDPLENSNLWAQQSKIWTHLKTILPG